MPKADPSTRSQKTLRTMPRRSRRHQAAKASTAVIKATAFPFMIGITPWRVYGMRPRDGRKAADGTTSASTQYTTISTANSVRTVLYAILADACGRGWLSTTAMTRTSMTSSEAFHIE